MSVLFAGCKWPIQALSRGYEPKLGKMLQPSPEKDEDRQVPYLRAGIVNWDGLIRDDLPLMWANPREVDDFGVRAGDLLVAEGGDAGRATIVAELPPNTIIQNSLHRIRGPAFELRFLYFVLAAIHEPGWLEAACNKATIGHLTLDKLRSLPIPAPGRDVKQRVVAFLNRETARIDSLIRRKLEMGNLIDERTRCWVAGAVCQGLRPTRLRESGIPGLGRCPDEWPVTALRHLAVDVQTGPFGSQLHAAEYVQGGVPVVNPANLLDGTIVVDESMTVAPDTVSRLSRHVLRPGDIVFGRRGQLGRAALVSDREAGWLCGTGSLRVRFRRAVFVPAYLREYLRLPAIRGYFESVAIGSTMDNLNSEVLLAMPLLVPPLEEQAEVAAAVDQRRATSLALLSKLAQQVGLMVEHRQALTTAAVTGQIDVRTSAA